MEKIIGIYKITNKLNNKSYIGQSIDILTRGRQHKHPHEKYAIHKAMDKYGIENFTFEVLERCVKEKLNEREIGGIATTSPEYNLTSGGDAPTNVSESTREKLREGSKRTILTKNLTFKGMKHTQEIKTHLKNVNKYRFKPVVDLSTGKEYESITDAAEKLGLERASIRYLLKTGGVSRITGSKFIRKESLADE